MTPLVECVPNFSEGRRHDVVDQIVAALTSVPNVYLLGREMDADHNRAVITIVGAPENIGEAALRGVDAAVRLIEDRKSTRLNSSHITISYAVFCLKKKNTT